MLSLPFSIPSLLSRPALATPTQRCLLLRPYLVIVALYFVIMYPLGETPYLSGSLNTLHKYGTIQCLAQIKVIAFPGLHILPHLILIVHRCEVSYQQWCDATMLRPKAMEISWPGLTVCE